MQCVGLRSSTYRICQRVPLLATYVGIVQPSNGPLSVVYGARNRGEDTTSNSTSRRLVWITAEHGDIRPQSIHN